MLENRCATAICRGCWRKPPAISGHTGVIGEPMMPPIDRQFDAFDDEDALGGLPVEVMR
jgi:hypothetical protein